MTCNNDNFFNEETFDVYSFRHDNFVQIISIPLEIRQIDWKPLVNFPHECQKIIKLFPFVAYYININILKKHPFLCFLSVKQNGLSLCSIPENMKNLFKMSI